MVDVTAQHQHHFVVHLLACDCVSTLYIALVTVHTLELHRLAVHIEITSRKVKLILFCGSILNLNLSESEMCRSGLYYLALLVLELNNESVAIGSLARPFVGIGHGNCYFCTVCGTDCGCGNINLHHRALDKLILVAEKFVCVKTGLDCIVLDIFLREVAYIDLDVCNAILIGLVKVGAHAHVAQLHRSGCCQ